MKERKKVSKRSLCLKVKLKNCWSADVLLRSSAGLLSKSSFCVSNYKHWASSINTYKGEFTMEGSKKKKETPCYREINKIKKWMSVELKETTRNKKYTLTAEKQKVHRPAGRWRKEQNTLHLNHWHCKPWCWSLWHQRRALEQHTHRCHTQSPVLSVTATLSIQCGRVKPTMI